jgi:hypothetical protein
LFQGNRPDHKLARKWKEDTDQKIFANGPSFTISGTVVGPVGVNEGTFNSEIDNFFQDPYERKSISSTRKQRKSNFISVVNETDYEEGKV